MARPLRIEYEDAWYHVMNRGANHESIFLTDDHRKIFLSLLKQVTDNYFIEVHAYCLMGNHYHLLVRTPYANLSKTMRHIDGVYTQRFNRSTQRDGPLFRGRYKSILIEENNYLLQVSRYIHLNPVEAKLCELPSNYLWSSYSSYITEKKEFSWISTSFVLSMIGGMENYQKFVLDGIDDDIKKFYSKKYLSPILGSHQFIHEKISKIHHKKSVESSGDIKRTKQSPEIELIIQIVSTYFQVEIKALVTSNNRQINIPRLFAIYLSFYIGQYSYKKIAPFFNIKSEGIRSAIKRFNKLDEKFKNCLQNLILKIAQTQT